MEDYNLAVLVDAKTEYTNQLTNLCKSHMYSCIQQLFKLSKQECEENSSDTFSTFQKKLALIPSWNSEKIKNEYDQLLISSNCDWLDELLTAVFMSHSRILSSVSSKSKQPQVSLDVPSFETFMHQCYIDIARCFWKSPYLFDDTVSSYDYQRNRRDCELMIEKTIGESLRKQLPVKHLLKNYLGEDIKLMKSVTIEQDMNDEEKENLRNMVKKEIKNNSPQEKEEKDESVSEKEKDKISLDIKEEPVEEKTQDTAVENENELETIEDIESVLSTPQEDDFPFDIELEDLTSSLQDDGAVYGLLEPEDTNTDIKEEVNNELLNLIENQEKNIKKVKVTEEPTDVDVTVTKINNPEYNFFTDAATTLK